MLILAKSIGILITGMGIIIFFIPDFLKRMVAFWEKGNRLYAAGVLRIAFGVILLLSASQCRLVGVVIALGILFLIGGIFIFALGPEKLKAIIRHFIGIAPIAIRLLAILPILIGALLIYAI